MEYCFRWSSCLLIPFIMILMILCFDSAYGIHCFQCSSNNQSDCSEKFDRDNSKLTAHSCDGVFEARFCIKTTGIWEGEIGTKRFCSSRDYGDYCEYIKRLGDERDYRSCVYTCSTDACNSSPQLKISPFGIFSTFLITSYGIMKRIFNIPF